MNTSKIDKAYTHFNNVDRYLRQKFDIRVRAEIVKELMGKLENIDIIDFGCGDGSISLQFQSLTNHITLVDISENMLERASLNIRPEYAHNIKTIKSDVLSFVSLKKYDVVMGLGLIAHVDSIPKTLKVMAGLLKENGVCLVQLTDSTKIVSRLLNVYNNMLDKVSGQFDYNRNRISVFQLNGLAKKHGLYCISQQQYSLVFPGFIGLMSDKLLYRYHSFVRKNAVLSSMGTDFILCFRKRK